ncbi:Protein of unknown function [Pyronema omphalodes CBS 100304]|uniref:Uncharacterized protein n=1 Tax=Pyronema omphalodes (strain CBS 100304) TaxID=1076935 RepID=U4LQE8_PYROM|nr:Protein of unknown function [Pyronema omphalodes CBS 100304]
MALVGDCVIHFPSPSPYLKLHAMSRPFKTLLNTLEDSFGFMIRRYFYSVSEDLRCPATRDIGFRVGIDDYSYHMATITTAMGLARFS